MNISTYEARIAALEAQLGPGPEPVQETGLVSVVVTPDITLSDGTSLNAKLAAMMPLESGQEVINENSIGNLEADYRVKIKPGSGWYAHKGGTQFGARGEEVARDVFVEVGGNFGINVLAAEDPSSQSAPHASIRITITQGALGGE